MPLRYVQDYPGLRGADRPLECVQVRRPGDPTRPRRAPSRTNWTRLVPPSVLTGHVSTPTRARPAGGAGAGLRRAPGSRGAQGPGDLVFLPPLWAHGVLYLQDTAGMASLFVA